MTAQRSINRRLIEPANELFSLASGLIVNHRRRRATWPLFLVLWLVPALAQAQFNFATNADGTLTIISYTGSGGDVSIPTITNNLPVSAIGDRAFQYSLNLTNVTIPNSVTSIGDNAFRNTSLTRVTIPDSVVTIGWWAFADSPGCTAITVDPLNPSYNSVDGVLFDQSRTTLIEFPPGRAGSYAIPNGVLNIVGGAFVSCQSVTSVTIPNSVANIAQETFLNCASLASVTIPDSVASIGDRAFLGCASLTSVDIPNSVTSLGQEAFSVCPALTNVTIGYGVTNIGSWVFSSVTNLTGVYFKGNAPSPDDWTLFLGDTKTTVYYLPGTTGWGVTLGGAPTAPWALPNPLILNHEPGFGVGTNGFGFVISWATNVSVVVEASTTLLAPNWSPISTNTLTGGSTYFSDPQWTNQPGRFYRLRSP